MTDSLIWPVITIVILYVLRKPLSNLIPKVKKVKFKDLEADFHELTVSDQSLLFLDGVSRKEQWTFYEKSREGERALGQAFLIIVRDLLSVERSEVIQKLKQWLASENNNLIWFASEIIGFFKIYELKEDLLNIVPKDTNVDLSTHQLNALWALARITNFIGLSRILQSTNSKINQEWILFVYDQMPNEREFTIERRIGALEEFINKNNLDEDIVLLANEILQRLKSPNKAFQPTPKSGSAEL